MDYKKILKTGKSRVAVLNALRFVPDSVMIPLQYKMKLGRSLNLKNPQRFTEKLQWYKMHYRNPMMHQCVDKYLVRDYVKGKGLEEILIPLIAHYNSIDEVQWDKLPDHFVMKTTHGGGGLNVVVCNNKKLLNLDEVKQKLSFKNKPVKKNTLGREWAYYGLQPGLVVEELLINIDGVLMVVRQNYDKKHTLDESLRFLKYADAHIIGFVLNCSSKGEHSGERYEYREEYRER